MAGSVARVFFLWGVNQCRMRPLAAGALREATNFMDLQKKSCLVFILAVLTIAPGAALATNGYFAHGYGTKSKSMTGAGVALPQDTLAAATNPSGMVMAGESFDGGAAIFQPNRSYTYEGPSPFFATAAQESDSDPFYIPHFGINWMVEENTSVGVSVFGNGGMNTDYAQPVYAGGSGRTGINLSQLFIATTYAIRVGSIAYGVSGIVAYQQFSAEGLQAFDNPLFSSNPGSVTNNGDDTANGIGIRLAILADVTPEIAVGFSYQPEIDMSKFESYSGLFAEQGDFNIPSTWTLGAAWKPTAEITLALDYQRISYSEVAAIGNPGESLIGAGTSAEAPVSLPEGTRLGEDNGLGFGWEEIDVIKLGAALALNDDWTVRLGWNIG